MSDEIFDGCAYWDGHANGVEEGYAEGLQVARQRIAELETVLREASWWLVAGPLGDSLPRQYWTPEYVAVIDRIDAIISKDGGAK